MPTLTIRGISQETIAALDDLGRERRVRSREALLRDILLRAIAEPAQSWRCFHCGDVFTSPKHAASHFGIDQGAEPGCVAVLRGGESHLLDRIHDLEIELVGYRAEDSHIMRWAAEKASLHAEALRREEEAGYARGLRDAKQEERV